MDINSTIKLFVHKLIHGKGTGKKNVDIYECAEHVNKSYSYLTRISSMNEDLPTPIEIVLPLMKLKNDYELLEQLAWHCGFVLVKLPKPVVKKADDYDVIENFSYAASEAQSCLNKAIKSGSASAFKSCLEALKNCTRESVNAHKYIEKKSDKQLNLNF